MGRRWRGGSHTALPADRLPPHVAIAAVALSIAATAVPLALILEPELRGQIAPPRFANLLLGLLLSVPAGVGLRSEERRVGKECGSWLVSGELRQYIEW